MVRRLRCPVCGSAGLRHKTEQITLSKGIKPVKAEFFSCQNCGYKFMEKRAFDSLHKRYRSAIQQWASSINKMR